MFPKAPVPTHTVPGPAASAVSCTVHGLLSLLYPPPSLHQSFQLPHKQVQLSPIFQNMIILSTPSQKKQPWVLFPLPSLPYPAADLHSQIPLRPSRIRHLPLALHALRGLGVLLSTGPQRWHPALALLTPRCRGRPPSGAGLECRRPSYLHTPHTLPQQSHQLSVTPKVISPAQISPLSPAQ